MNLRDWRTGKEWIDLHLRGGDDKETLQGNSAVMKFAHLTKRHIQGMLREKGLPVSGSRREISIRLLKERC